MPAHVARHLSWHFGESGIDPCQGPEPAALVCAQRERSRTLVEMLDKSGYFYRDFDGYDEKAARKNLTPDSKPVLVQLRDRLASLGEWRKEQIHDVVAEVAERLGLKLRSFDDYETLLRRLVVTQPERHQVALKNALAYDRSVLFDEPDERTARRAWGKSDPTPEERKAFGDFVVDRLAAIAGQDLAQIPRRTNGEESPLSLRRVSKTASGEDARGC